MGLKIFLFIVTFITITQSFVVPDNKIEGVTISLFCNGKHELISYELCVSTTKLITEEIQLKLNNKSGKITVPCEIIDTLACKENNLSCRLPINDVTDEVELTIDSLQSGKNTITHSSSKTQQPFSFYKAGTLFAETQISPQTAILGASISRYVKIKFKPLQLTYRLLSLFAAYEIEDSLIGHLCKESKEEKDLLVCDLVSNIYISSHTYRILIDNCQKVNIPIELKVLPKGTPDTGIPDKDTPSSKLPETGIPDKDTPSTKPPITNESNLKKNESNRINPLHIIMFIIICLL